MRWHSVTSSIREASVSNHSRVAQYCRAISTWRSTAKPRPTAAGSTRAWYPVMMPLRFRLRTRRRHGDGERPPLSARSVLARRPSATNWLRIGRSSTPLGFAIASTLLILAPGPDSPLVMRNTLRLGRRAGWVTAAGTVSGPLAWAVAAALGLSALLRASQVGYDVLRLEPVARRPPSLVEISGAYRGGRMPLVSASGGRALPAAARVTPAQVV
jgi:LysE type translocator